MKFGFSKADLSQTCLFVYFPPDEGKWLNSGNDFHLFFLPKIPPNIFKRYMFCGLAGYNALWCPSPPIFPPLSFLSNSVLAIAGFIQKVIKLSINLTNTVTFSFSSWITCV